jgi:hypothetical protein
MIYKKNIFYVIYNFKTIIMKLHHYIKKKINIKFNIWIIFFLALKKIS